MSRSNARFRAATGPRRFAVRRGVAAAALAVVAAGCDPGQRDAGGTAAQAIRTNHVLLRVDLPAVGSASVSALAFRADLTGRAEIDVLSAVDPLMTGGAGQRCEWRDGGAPIQALRAAGAVLALDDLGHVGVEVDGAGFWQTSPQVYPELAGVVGGVIAELGPVDVLGVPEVVRIALPGAGTPVAVVSSIALPRPFYVTDAEGRPLGGAIAVVDGEPLVLGVAGDAPVSLELRPFGATLALVCPVTAGSATVAADVASRLRDQAGAVPLSVAAVWRRDQTVQAIDAQARITIEVRASAIVELSR